MTPSSDRADVIVVGAGLLGLSTAHALAQRGRQVLVVEAREEVGCDSSFANGALLTPAMCDPWNSPGIERAILASLTGAHSPITVRYRALPSLLAWGIRFLRCSTPARHLAATVANFALASYSTRLTAQWRADLGLRYDESDLGTMKVFASGEAMAGPLALVRMLEAHGLRYQLLDHDGVLGEEPALAQARSPIHGGLRFPDDKVGDAHLFCRGLAASLRGRGVRILTRTRVTAITRDGNRAAAIVTPDGPIAARDIVVAAGTALSTIVRPLGMSVAIAPMKGYSVTFATPAGVPVPRIGLIDDAAHTAVIPLGGRLRLAGIAEAAGLDRTVQPPVVEGLFTKFEALLPEAARAIDHSTAIPWAGFRPMSADGRPLVGGTTLTGLWLNGGHGHLGWTQAAGSGDLLADLMTGAQPALDPTPYSPAGRH